MKKLSGKTRLAALCAVLVLLAGLVLGACGAKSEAKPASGQYSRGYAEENAVYAAAAPMFAADEAAEMEWEESGMRDAGLASVSGSGAASAKKGGESAEVDPEKIIYSADVTVESTEFDQALAGVEALVERYGGWIEASSVSGANYYDISRGRTTNRSASFTLRIPGERFHELMGSLSELGNVPYSYIYTENVTAQYYDMQARMTALQTQEARLLEMVSAAESVEDLLLIEERLGEVRCQIESMQTTLRGWDRRVSYSTVELRLNEVREYTPETPVKLTLGERISRAFSSGLRAVGDFLEGALLWLVGSLPALLLLGALLLVLIPLGRRLLKRRAARRAKKAAAKAESENRT